MIPNNILINLNSDQNIFDYVSNGITITDKHSKIIYINPAFSKITGYTREEIIGKNPGALHSGRHGKPFYDDMWQQITSKGFWNGEIWNRRKSGEIYPEFLTISKIQQDNSNNFFYVGIFADISFLKKDIARKLHLAFYDPLTELPNRASYLDRINKAMERKEANLESTFVIFYMDLDKFKQVNDTYGHCIGDKLLKQVGHRLTSVIRSGDTIARMGGDEFAAILTTDIDKQAATALAKRILNQIETPFLIDNHTLNISISIGIVFYLYDASNNLETLLSHADQAMYKAKKTGTKIEIYNMPEQ